MIVINLFAGPGTGKSTNAAALFAIMKRNYFNVELVQEYAKDLTWEDRLQQRSEQDWVLANQNKRLRRLIGKVDYAITDGPVLQSTVYVPEEYYITCMKQHIMDVHSSYNNINFFLTRVKKYVPIGRDQSEVQAKKIDEKIMNLLIDSGEPFHHVEGNEQAADEIYKIILKEIGRDIK